MNSSKSGEGGACNPAEMENRASKLTSQQTFQDATVLVAAGLAGRGLDILGQLRVLLRSHRVNEVLAEQPIYCNTRPAQEHDGVTVSPPARVTPPCGGATLTTSTTSNRKETCTWVGGCATAVHKTIIVWSVLWREDGVAGSHPLRQDPVAHRK